MKTTSACLIGILLSAVLISACASTKIIGSWKDSGFHGTVKKVMVVAVVRSRAPRALIEKEFVGQLQNHGTAAVGAESLLQSDELPTRETVSPYVIREKADSILVIKFIKKETIESHVPESNQGVPVTFDADMNTIFQPFSDPGERDIAYDYTKTTMHLALYSAETAKPVWTATSETLYQDNPVNHIRSFVSAVLKNLVSEKLIP